MEEPRTLYSAARRVTSSVSQGLSTLARGALRPAPHPTVTQLIEDAGLRVEEHSVTTEDGYILQLHRLVLHHCRGPHLSAHDHTLVQMTTP